MELYFSNSVRRLHEVLAEQIRWSRGSNIKNTLLPVKVVVPDYATERCVQIELVKSAGVSANMQFYSFQAYFEKWFEALGINEKILHQKAYETLCYKILCQDDWTQNPKLAPLKSYLTSQSEDEKLVDIRRVQLSQRLGRIFEKYGLYRMHMLDSWEKGKALFKTGHVESTERWQQQFWLEILQVNAKSENEKWSPLHQVLKRVDASFPKVSLDQAAEESVYFFGFSHFPPVYHWALSLLQKSRYVHVFGLNPSQQYWGDLERKRSWFEEVSVEDSDNEVENPLLKAWGRFGKENIHALIDLNGGEFNDCFVEPQRQQTSLLANIQKGLLDCTTPSVKERESDKRKEDKFENTVLSKTIAITASKNIRQELTHVSEAIWQCVQQGVFFNDLCILIPANQMASYFPVLESVFHQSKKIPHHWVDVSLSEQNLLTQAALFLLDLPFHTWSHSRLKQLLQFPQVYTAIGACSPEQVLNFLDPLGFTIGTHADFFEDTYVTQDILNLDQGLKRAGLGAWMWSEPNLQSAYIFENSKTGAEHSYFPYEPKEEWSRNLGTYLRSLSRDMHQAEQTRWSLEEWAGFFSTVFKNYLLPCSSEDHYALRKCLDATRYLTERPNTKTKVSFQVAAHWLAASIRSSQINLGEIFGEGVTIGSCGSLKNVPLKYVWMVGLDERNFPRTETKEMIDLSLQKKIVGDPHPNDQDTYGLLEVLAQTKNQVHLSYVNRDEMTGEAVEPSSLIPELQRTVRQYYCAYKEEVDIQVHQGSDEPKNLSEEDLTSVGSISHEKDPIAKTKHFFKQVENTNVQIEGSFETTLLTLVRFLECPLNGWAKEVLGLRSQFESRQVDPDEELTRVQPLHRATVLRNAFYGHMRDTLSLESHYRQRRNYLQAQGKWSLGLLSEKQEQEDIVVLQSWKQTLESLDISGSRALELWSFGQTPLLQNADRIFEPLQLTDDFLEKEKVQFVIHGQTAPLIHQGRDTFLPQFKPIESGEKGRINRLRVLLRIFLDHVLLSIHDESQIVSSRSVYFAFPDGEPFSKVDFNPIDTNKAKEWLGNLMVDLNTRQHAYYLPCEAVLKTAKQYPWGHADSIVENIGWVKEKLDGGSSRFGPVVDLWNYPEPSLEEVLLWSRRRFGFFLEHIETPLEKI